MDTMWNKRDRLRWVIPAALAALIWLAFPRQVALAAQLLAGGYLLAFLVEPLARRLERHMGPKPAALMSVALFACLMVGALLLLVPPIARQMADLAQGLPRFTQRLEALAARSSQALQALGLPALDPAALDMNWLGDGAARLLSGTASFAGSVVDGFVRLGLSIMLGIYFLLDRRQLAIRLELLAPLPAREIVLRMAAEVGRGLRAYLRGQMTIALIVGALAALGLWIAGVRSPLALGAIVGIFNMIPYFGPILGGIPAVLTALGQGLWTCIFALIALFVVQQLDGMLISPRVMSGVTGMSPAAVLLALTLGGSAWGIPGMLFALPILLIVRICFRVWASRNEMIEKPPKV